jgi:hypothetical protein
VTYGTPHQGANLSKVATSLNNKFNQLADLAEFNLNVAIPLFGHFDQQFDALGRMRDGVQDTISWLGIPANINSASACDLNPTCSAFIGTVSDFQANPLPDPQTDEVTYVSLQGRVTLLTDALASAASLTGKRYTGRNLHTHRRS